MPAISGIFQARSVRNSQVGTMKIRRKTMPTSADPIVGMWYKHFDKGEKFEVVAYE
jgi:hypothetical protein